MHGANVEFWRRVRADYPERFKQSRVIEFGSADICGSVRQFFKACDYRGLDWRPGKGVDIVCLAHEAPKMEPFDVVISASMLEHDPYWVRSLRRMVDLLRSDGILLLSWGAAENTEHCHDAAPDGAFHALPAGLVLDELAHLGVYVHVFCYEASLKEFGPGETVPGGVALVAFKDEAFAKGPRAVESLHEADLPRGIVEA